MGKLFGPFPKERDYYTTTHFITLITEDGTELKGFMSMDKQGTCLYKDGVRYPYNFKAEREKWEREEREAKEGKKEVDWNKFKHDGQQSYDECQYWIEKWRAEEEARGGHWCGD